MPSSAVCVDASFVVALVTAEAASRNALDLWAEWTMAEVQVIAPALLRYEVTAALRRKVVRGVMSSQDARRALEEALGLDIEYVDAEGLPLQAFALAESLGRPTTYRCSMAQEWETTRSCSSTASMASWYHCHCR
ncbi:MAG: type II toxin-antitoxin system VapC family toxin [Anaerolineae bacterium]